MPFSEKILSNLKNLDRIYFPSQSPYLTDSDIYTLVHKAEEQKATIKKLLVGDNELTDESINWISKLTELEVLDLSANEITDEGGQKIADIFDKLCYLNLSSTKISDATIAVLMNKKNITTLILDDTEITNDVVDLLLKNESLTCISILYTKISQENSNKIMAHVGKNNQIKSNLTKPPSPNSKENTTPASQEFIGSNYSDENMLTKTKSTSTNQPSAVKKK